MSQIRKIGVIGGGNMGSGIAQKIAQEGIPVVMVDLKDEFVQRGLGTIRRLLQEGVERKIFKPEQVEQILSRVTGTTDFKAVADADIVIEARSAHPRPSWPRTPRASSFGSSLKRPLGRTALSVCITSTTRPRTGCSR